MSLRPKGIQRTPVSWASLELCHFFHGRESPGLQAEQVACRCMPAGAPANRMNSRSQHSVHQGLKHVAMDVINRQFHGKSTGQHKRDKGRRVEWLEAHRQKAEFVFYGIFLGQ